MENGRNDIHAFRRDQERKADILSVVCVLDYRCDAKNEMQEGHEEVL